MKTSLITIKSTQEFKKRVQEAAEKEERSMSGFIRDCIFEKLKRDSKNGTDKT